MDNLATAQAKLAAIRDKVEFWRKQFPQQQDMSPQHVAVLAVVLTLTDILDGEG